MTVAKSLRMGSVAWIVAALLAVPAGATTLARVGLAELVAENSTIVVGQVMDVFSYWNDEGTFILTDVRLATSETLKGRVRNGEVTVTLMGGTVGGTTALIVGGAQLFEGGQYVLFLNREELPGRRAVTVRDHVQGVFQVFEGAGGLRAVSQANSHPLMPDLFGNAEPPGGAAGLALTELTQQIRVIERSSRALQN